MLEQARGTLLGVIVQFGGQTPLKRAQEIEDAGSPILGTSPDAIDLAEDREHFAALIERLGLKQPANGIARSREEALAVAERIGYPVLMRPSYVLGGRAMEIVEDAEQLDNYIQFAVQVSGDRSEEHTSELQSLMRISYDVFFLKKKKSIHNVIHKLGDTIKPAMNVLINQPTKVIV